MEETEAAVRRRREDAFDRHVTPEIPVLLRVARSLTGQPADAEDLVQDTLIRAYRSLDRFDGAHPRAWLLTILRHTEINRNRGRRPQLLDDRQLEQVASTPAGETPEGVVVGAAFDEVVENAVGALPEKFRTAVELVDVDGLTYAEAARALGIPPGTAMSRVHRARSRIRARLVAAGLVPKRGVR